MSDWTQILAEADINGDADPDASVCWGAGSVWDAMVDEIRNRLEAMIDVWLTTLPAVYGGDWTRGAPDGNGALRLALMNGGQGDDAFYVSHIQDLRDVINSCEEWLGWGYTEWSEPILRAKYNTLGALIPYAEGVETSQANRTLWFDQTREAADQMLGIPLQARTSDGY